MRIKKIEQTIPNMSTVIGANDTPNEKDVYSSSAIKEMIEVNIVTDGQPVKTGRKIDGKDEYVKRMNLGKGPNAGSSKKYNLLGLGLPQNITYINHNLSFGESTNRRPLPLNLNDSVYDVYTWFNDNCYDLRVKTGSSGGINNDNIYMEYYFTYNEVNINEQS